MVRKYFAPKGLFTPDDVFVCKNPETRILYFFILSQKMIFIIINFIANIICRNSLKNKVFLK